MPTQNFRPFVGRLAGEPEFRKKLQRFGGYGQNFILEWPSMWCSDCTEILCANNSCIEEHPLKILRDLHAQFGRWFRTIGGGGGGGRGRVHVSWAFGTVGGDLSTTQGDWLVCF